MQDATVNALTARLDRLEASNRRYRRLLAGLLGLFAVVAVLRPTPSEADGKKDGVFGTVQAERIAIMKDGQVAILIGAQKKTSISLFDDAKNVRATLSVDDAAMLSLNGADKKPRAVIGHNPSKGSHVILWSEDGKAKEILH